MKSQYEKRLAVLRKQIDRVDLSMIQLLKKRKSVVESIGLLKAEFGVPVYQRSRWSEVIKERLKWAKESGIDLKFVEKMYKEIHKEAVRIQNALKKGKSHG